MRRYLVPLGMLLFIALFAVFPPASFSQPERGRARMEEYLNLTPAQKAQLEENRKAAREERRAHFDQMSKLRLEFRELIKKPEADEKKIESLIDEMSRLRSARLKSGLRDIREKRKMLTPEQLEKLGRLKARMGRRGIAGRGHLWPRDGGWLGRRQRPFWRRHAYFPHFRLGWRL